MKVICISGKAEHGKDITANILKSALEASGHTVLIAHYGDLLKYICKTFFGWDGKKDEAGRALLQYVGTNKIRKRFPDFWVDFIASILSIFRDEWDYVLIPDCRFQNEHKCLKRRGLDTYIIRVTRPDHISSLTPQQLNHPSETALDHYKYDYHIINEGSVEDLEKAVKRMIETGNVFA